MKRLTKGVAFIAASCLVLAVIPRLARSADHLDGADVKKDPTTDINDLYSFMDGNNAVFALTVFPAAPADAKFSDKVQYVIHTTSSAKFGDPETAKDIICTFNATQQISCWLGATDEFVSGDASVAAGIASADGKMKVYAGRRADPFFFSLDSFRDTVKTVQGAAGGLTFDDAGCPAVDAPTSGVLVNKLKNNPDAGQPATPAIDFFKNLNTLAIVVAVDKSLVTGGGPIVSSWASTNKGQ